MFAYCNNNPVNLVDSTGCYPAWFIEEPHEKAIEEFAEWFWEIDENEVNSNGELTLKAKTKQLVRSMVHNTEVSVGVGLGIFAESTVLEIFGVGAGAYYNPLSIQIQDCNISAGQEINQGIAASLYGHNYGNVESGFNVYGEAINLQGNIGFYNDETITIFSAAKYQVVGGSFRIGFDILGFIDDVDRIF